MNVGDRIRHTRYGHVLEYIRDDWERAGTKERLVYVCKAVSPSALADGREIRVSVYALHGAFPGYERLPMSAVDRLAELTRDTECTSP